MDPTLLLPLELETEPFPVLVRTYVLNTGLYSVLMEFSFLTHTLRVKKKVEENANKINICDKEGWQRWWRGDGVIMWNSLCLPTAGEP